MAQIADGELTPDELAGGASESEMSLAMATTVQQAPSQGAACGGMQIFVKSVTGKPGTLDAEASNDSTPDELTGGASESEMSLAMATTVQQVPS